MVTFLISPQVGAGVIPEGRPGPIASQEPACYREDKQ
jgi:hypothetical protein